MSILNFTMTKGPIWSAFDRFFSRSDLEKRLQHKLDVLESLHRSERFTDFDRETTSGIDVQALKNHINREWFGFQKMPGGSWTAPPSPDHARPESIRSTGAWSRWAGNAEAIVRETVLRGIEISLGVSHLVWRGDRKDPLAEYGLARGKPSPRNWPIEFWCAGPVDCLQGSLTWRTDPDGGRVIITWMVPYAGNPPIYDFMESRDDFIVNPPNPSSDEERFGSWIIGQEHTSCVLRTGPEPMMTVSVGPPVVISPTFAMGGVDPYRED